MRRSTILTWLNLLLMALASLAMALWWTGIGAKELAVLHARTACSRQELQLLDQTVALGRIRISRDQQGQACLRREYRFEYTRHGTHRDVGTVVMNGHKLVSVSFPFIRDENGNRIFLH